MADPISLTLLAVGTAVSAGSQIIGSMQQAKSAEYSAKVYEAEAITQKKAAEYEEKKHRDNVRRFIGIQRARYGASGIDISAGGSAEAVLGDTAVKGEMDALAIRYGGDVAAILARNRANLLKFEAKSTRSSGLFGAGSTLLSGATQAYSINKEAAMRLKSK
jgi:hypothetical protein